MTTEPNTAEEIFRKNEKGRMLTYRNTPEFIIEAMHEHTAQTLNRLKEQLNYMYGHEPKPKGTPEFGYNRAIADVIELIEELKNENI